MVLVSGTGSVTPFTTPTEACTKDFSAGSTYAYLRDALVDEGFAVYTAPVMAAKTPVPTELAEAQGGPFAGCPEQLPLEVTIDSIESPELGGQALAAFLAYLNTEYGITQVDLVAHSLGGIFTRNGIAELQMAGTPVKVRSFTTLGSPWEPVMPAVPPYKPKQACDGLAICMAFVKQLMVMPSVKEIVDSFQPEAFNPWSQSLAGSLDDIPVTLVAGTYYTKPQGRADKWPNDGIVQFSAATARSVSDAVLPIRACFVEPGVHSGWVAERVGEDASLGINWNETTTQIIATTIRNAGTPSQFPNRLGCPPPAK